MAKKGRLRLMKSAFAQTFLAVLAAAALIAGVYYFGVTKPAQKRAAAQERAALNRRAAEIETRMANASNLDEAHQALQDANRLITEQEKLSKSKK